MMRRRILPTGLLALLAFLPGCFAEDERIPALEIPRDLRAARLDSSIYTHQTYFDLDKGQAIATHSLYAWDLSFESGDGFRVLLNSGRLMAVAELEGATFGQPVSAPPASSPLWRWDALSGNLDSTAFGEWGRWDQAEPSSLGKVYVLDLGIDANGAPLGMRQLSFGDFSDGHYLLRHARLDGSEPRESRVPKVPGRAFVQHALAWPDQGALLLQPESWHLVSSQVRANLQIPGTETFLPYLVRGAYTNRQSSRAFSLGQELPFDSVDWELSQTVFFDERIDNIGHDWKTFDLEGSNLYSVLDDKIYLVRASDERLYKLRFVGFYGPDGERGLVGFEYQRL